MTGFRWTIKRKLLALGAATFLPLLLLLAFWVWWEVQEQTKDAEAELALASRQAAGQVELLLGEVTRLLRVLAQSSAVRRRQIDQIEELFRQVTAEHPELQGLIAVTADGRTFASVPEPTGAPATMADRSWFKQVMATGKPVVGGFLIGRITGQPVAVVAVPLRARDGAPTGALAAGLSFRQLHLLFQSLPLAAGRTVTVLDGEGLVLSHAPGAEGWTGRRLPSAGALPAGAALVKKLAWSEGGERVVAVAPVEGTGWRVLVGIPRTSLEARVWKEIRAIVFPLLALLALSSFIGLLIAMRVWWPLRTLADATKRLLEEKEHVPIRVDSTDEVGELAEAFNAMAAQVTEARSRLAQRVTELTALSEVGHLLTKTLELPEVLQRLTELAQARLGADIVRIWLHEAPSGELRLYAHTGVTRPGEEYRRRFGPGEGLVGWIMEHREPLVLADCQSDPRLTNREWIEAEGLHAFLGIPILLEDMLVGILVCMSRERGKFPSEEMALAQLFAVPAAVAIRNARLFEQSERRRKVAESLAEVGRLISQSLNPEEVGQRIADSLRTLLGTFAAALYRLEPESEDLVAVAVSGDVGPTFGRKLVFPRGSGVAGLAVRERRLVVTPDLLSDPRVALTAELRERIEQATYRAVLAVPLVIKDTVIGALGVGDRAGRVFDEEEIRLLQGFAAEAAIALENAQLYHRAEERSQKLKAFGSLVQLMTSVVDSRQVFQAVAKAATTLIGAKLTRVWVADPDARALRVQGDFGLDPSFLQVASDVRVLPYGAGLAGQVFESRVPEYVPDVQQDPRWLDQKLAKEAGLHAYAGIPLITEGQVVGVLAILLGEQRPFTSEEKELLDLLAGQAAIAVENARLFDEARRLTEALTEQNRQRQLLHDAQRALIAKYDLASLLQYLIGTAAELIGARYGALAVLGEDGKVMQFRTTGIDAETQERIGSLPEGRGLIGVVLRENEVLRLEDLTADPRAAGFPPHHPPMRRLLAAPIRLEDRTLGAIYLADKDESFTPEDQDLLTTLCADAAVAIENARLVQELNQALEKLKATQHQLVRSETLRAVGVLASGAAHHLNNLLAVILGNIQLLIEQVRKAEIRQPLELVEQTTRDAAEVVRRMQRFSRAEPFARLVTVDLNALAREVLELARPLWQDKAQVRGVQIEAALDPGEIPAVAGEPAALSEVFMNLLINAVEALPEGGKIAVKTWRSGPWVHCSVTDSGVGMSAHVRERALEPFFTSKGPKSTGLGLSVSYGIIQRHGGEMGIESAEGRGTTVTIRLPLAPGTAVEQPEPAASGALPLILVIEDEARVREMLVKMLSSQGHRVLQAAGGQEGLARLAAGEPVGLVLTDLGMPGMTGWEVARAVKAQWPHLPVGLITGWGEEPEASAEDRSAVDFVISKPVTLEALRKALAGRRPQPAKRDGPTSSTSECSGRSPRDLCSGE